MLAGCIALLAIQHIVVSYYITTTDIYVGASDILQVFHRVSLERKKLQFCQRFNLFCILIFVMAQSTQQPSVVWGKQTEAEWLAT